MAVLSIEPVAIKKERGSKARQTISAVCPFKVLSNSPLSVLQIFNFVNKNMCCLAYLDALIK
jgi:hypothetical protein